LKADVRQVLVSTHEHPLFFSCKISILPVLGGIFGCLYLSLLRHVQQKLNADGFDFGYVRSFILTFGRVESEDFYHSGTVLSATNFPLQIQPSGSLVLCFNFMKRM
jgi:hypothetical protein